MAGHRLVTANLRFVVKVAREYLRYRLSFADLVQEGNMGLIRAVEKFDPDRGVRLTTYAVWWIRAYIHAFILRSWSLVRLGTRRADRKVFFGLAKARRDLRRAGLNEDTDELTLLSERLGVSTKDLASVMPRISSQDSSLDATVGDEEFDRLVDFVSDGTPSPARAVEWAESHDELAERIYAAIERLNERQRFVVENRLLTDEPRFLWQIGEDLHLSRERVRQIEREALRKLRDELADLEDHQPMSSGEPSVCLGCA